MKRAKAAGGIAYAIMIIVYLGYIATHIYFAYYAFTTFKLWFAILVFVAPVIGDIAFIGASIGFGNWIPFIIITAIGILYYASDALAKAAENRLIREVLQENENASKNT